MTTVLVFGDSVTQGFWDIEGGWVQRLRTYIDKKCLENPSYYFSTFNLGVSGDTSKDLLERFEFETKMRLNEAEKKEEVIIIFSAGSNDSMYNNKTKKHLTSEQNFKKNLIQLFNMAKKYSTNIIFVGDMPVDENKVDPIPWVKNCSYKNEFVGKYNKIAEDVSKKERVLFIDIYNKFINEEYKELLQDGCHPNSKGHEMIFEIVRKELIEMKIIP